MSVCWGGRVGPTDAAISTAASQPCSDKFSKGKAKFGLLKQMKSISQGRSAVSSNRTEVAFVLGQIQ